MVRPCALIRATRRATSRTVTDVRFLTVVLGQVLAGGFDTVSARRTSYGDLVWQNVCRNRLSGRIVDFQTGVVVPVASIAVWPTNDTTGTPTVTASSDDR